MADLEDEDRGQDPVPLELSKIAYFPRITECFLISGQLNKSFEEQLLKQSKTGFNLANYNLDSSISELSVSVDDKQGNNSPLRVELPPQKMDLETNKVLSIDQDEKRKKDKINKNNENKQNQNESRLNIEEFECGVQFEGSEKNKQEWSFTLYDFDGHGKITKEDLASLLKALYDAVGSSIKIPSNGTKTLKLRLSVGQDGSQLTSTIKDSPKVKVKDKPKNSDRAKDNSKSKESPSKPKEFSKLNNLTATHVQLPAKQCNSDAQCKDRVKSPCKGQGQCAEGQKSCQGQESAGTKRIQLTTQEQQQLVELVQENMERNHIKQLRRHHSDCRGTSSHDHSHHKRRHGHCSNNHSNVNNVTAVSNNQEERAKESQDRRNYYLDLAGIEHNAKPQPSAQNLTNPIGQSHKDDVTCHQRSKSHDLSKKCDNIKRESERYKQFLESQSKGDHLRSKSSDPQETSARSPKGHHRSSPHKHGRFRPMSLPGHVPESMSHYQRRHRHREKDHDLAMQQVAEWIEREHSCDVEGDHIVVQKHEHHHIHEHHHHHHYHHYYEA
ncbi:hypothetical protein FSP39_022726 [Pinctada imbricata]|uniref:Protein naked cuticle homolog n=1 Tax=Pinctada imbricata TaxID=66713 RepID=A0AA89BLA2_PINIB|nr:hypothetical protein FSP39_022726 [Pinctada imbricata]